jgi:hypothetical protein
MASSRTWLWLTVVIVIVIGVIVYMTGGGQADRPGAPPPHAIDQDQ